MRKWSDPVLGWICTHGGPAPFTAHSNLQVAGQPPRTRNLMDFRVRRTRCDHRQIKLPLSIWGHPVEDTVQANACSKGYLVGASTEFKKESGERCCASLTARSPSRTCWTYLSLSKAQTECSKEIYNPQRPSLSCRDYCTD